MSQVSRARIQRLAQLVDVHGGRAATHVDALDVVAAVGQHQHLLAHGLVVGLGDVVAERVAVEAAIGAQPLAEGHVHVQHVADVRLGDRGRTARRWAPSAAGCTRWSSRCSSGSARQARKSPSFLRVCPDQPSDQSVCRRSIQTAPCKPVCLPATRSKSPSVPREPGTKLDAKAYGSRFATANGFATPTPPKFKSSAAGTRSAQVEGFPGNGPKPSTCALSSTAKSRNNVARRGGPTQLRRAAASTSGSPPSPGA